MERYVRGNNGEAPAVSWRTSTAPGLITKIRPLASALQTEPN